MTTTNNPRTFVSCFTSCGGTSAKIRKARQWTRLQVLPCPFCRSRPTAGSWMEHIIAKHAPVDGFARTAWLTAFNFGEVGSARNCTNGSFTNRAA